MKLDLGTYKAAEILNTPKRDQAGKYKASWTTRATAWLANATRKTFQAVAVVAVLALAFAIGGAFYSTSTIVVSANEVNQLPVKIGSLKADVVNQISDCERAGHTEADGLIVFDSNARASLGVMQFQVATVQQYEKILYGKDVSGKDAILIALDASQAKTLASDIIFKEDGLGNWLNCANKLGLRAQVNAINTISR